MFWDNLDKKKQYLLPAHFSFCNLKQNTFELIHQLLIDHLDNDECVRKEYHRDYIYWFFKTTREEYCLGLLHKDILVGVLLLTFVKYHVNHKFEWIPVAWKFCLQENYRQKQLSLAMLNEMKNRVESNNIHKIIFEDQKQRITPCFQISLANIPVNYHKLKQLNLIDGDTEELINGDFHLMKETDVSIITEKLNQFNHCYQVAPWMDDDQTKNFLLPRKNVVYTFVKKNDNVITDMISFYFYYMNLMDENEKIVVAHLGMYFFATMTLEKMINAVKSNLKYYGFDQISYHEYGQCEKLNLVSYETNDICYYAMHGCKDIITDFNAFCFIPI